MEFWKKTCLLVCCFGFFKELRPSESFLNNYLTGSVQGLTNDQTVYEIYPVWTYSYMAQLVLVFLLTDILRYKPILVLGSVMYIVVWCILIWGRGVQVMKLMEFCYAITNSTEVAYYSYIYAQVTGDVYSKVTGFTRAANLAGRTIASFVGQALYSAGVLSPYQLNFVSLGFVSVALLFAIAVPPVQHSIYFYPKHVQDYQKFTNENENCKDESHQNTSSNDNTRNNDKLSDIDPVSLQTHADTHNDVNIEGLTKTPSGMSLHTRINMMCHLLYREFIAAYSDKHIVKWSIWWIFATAGYLQVLNYVQALWSSIDPTKQNVYNGVVEGTSTLFGSMSALSVSVLPLKLEVWGEVYMAVGSLVQAGSLFIMALAGNTLAAYLTYVVFRVTYEFIITMAEFQIARHLKAEAYGLVFGVNMFLSLVIQSLITLLLNTILLVPMSTQFVVYGCGFVLLSAIFWAFCAFSCARGDYKKQEAVPHSGTLGSSNSSTLGSSNSTSNSTT